LFSLEEKDNLICLF